jgi:hypothetical protein
MREEPGVALGLPRRLRLGRLTKCGQELPPGKFEVGAFGEVDIACSMRGSSSPRTQALSLLE